MQLPCDMVAIAARFKKLYAGLVYDAREHFGLNPLIGQFHHKTRAMAIQQTAIRRLG